MAKADKTFILMQCKIADKTIHNQSIIQPMVFQMKINKDQKGKEKECISEKKVKFQIESAMKASF